MATNGNRKRLVAVCVITMLLVLIVLILLKCIVFPLYTKSLFKPLAKKTLFPEYTFEDIESVEKECKYQHNFECNIPENANFAQFTFFGGHTELYGEIYDNVAECEKNFGYEKDFYDKNKGCLLVNDDDFKVYISKKTFDIGHLDFNQNFIVQRGTTLYTISRYGRFSQKDFKEEILLLMDTKGIVNTSNSTKLSESTKTLFDSIAKESLFPAYTSTDIENMKELYGYKLDFSTEDCYVYIGVPSFSFNIDSGTYFYASIFDTSKEGAAAFESEMRYCGLNGDFLVNKDEFKVYVTKKRFCISDFNFEQELIVQNGTTVYSISRSGFFSQKEFRDDILSLG